MIEFCNRVIHGELIIAAKHLGYIESDIFGGSIMTLNDGQVKTCISEIIKARTADDFIQKLKQVKFHMLEKDDYFAPNALSFPKLLKAAYLFNHNFIKIIKAISLRADPKVIPPVYREGKTTGLVDYYLACWPNDAGNNLYARVCVSEPSLRVHTCLEEFIYAFTKAIEAYAKVKQDYDDLNSVLKCRPGETPAKAQHGNAHNGQPHSKDRGRFAPTPNRREQLHYHEDSYASIPDEADLEDSILNFGGREDPTAEPDQELEEESFPEEDDLMAMVGSGPQHTAKEKPCFWKFKYGKCTSPGCKLDHSEAAMVQMRNMRIKELAMSPYKPKQAELTTQFDRFAKEGPPAKPQDNPRARA
jgi:hypothetical protein